MQEVKEEVYSELVGHATQYQYNYYHDLDGEYAGNTFLIANVHLPWNSVMKKEQYIVDINNEIKKIDADYAFLTGDFNSSGASSVHHYLTGQRTLLNIEANPIWEDLGEVHAQRRNTKLEYTLNLINNPRWKGKNLPCSSERFDRIYIRCFPKVFSHSEKFLSVRYRGR